MVSNSITDADNRWTRQGQGHGGLNYNVEPKLTAYPHSHTRSLRWRLRQLGLRKSQRAKALHVRQAKGSRRRHEGDTVGASPQEGTDESEVVDNETGLVL